MGQMVGKVSDTHVECSGFISRETILKNFVDLLLCTQIIIICEYCVTLVRCVHLKPNADLVVEDERPHETQDQLEVPTHNVSTACREWEDTKSLYVISIRKQNSQWEMWLRTYIYCTNETQQNAWV